MKTQKSDYFKTAPPKSDYETKEDLLNAISEMKHKMGFHEKEYEHKKKVQENLEIVQKRKPSVLAVFLIMLILRFLIAEDNSFFYLSGFERLSFVSKFWITLLMLFVVPVIYWCISRILIFRKIRKYESQLDSCEQELMKIYESYGTCPISFRYAMPDLVNEIEDMISEGRADTVKEAINYILSDENANRLYDVNSQIAKSSKQTAYATTATAFFSWRTSKWAKQRNQKDNKDK